MNVRKIITVALLAFGLYFVVQRPAPAANTAKHAGTGLSHAADSAENFLARITG